MNEPPPTRREGQPNGGTGRVREGLRRPYRCPTLTEYGSVAKLTQGSLTIFSDGAMGGFLFMMFCL
jgi:hypothetical protein